MPEYSISGQPYKQSTTQIPAMSPNQTHESAPYNSPPITIVLTVILLIFFFLGFFSIYFCKCFVENIANTWHLRHSPSGTPVNNSTAVQGLDPTIVESFPIFKYSSVKDLRQGKENLECAICLSEFGDEDLLRLLTACCHIFHQDCIDLWLQSHKTCPVCRRSLDEAEVSLEKSPLAVCNITLHDIDEINNQPTEGSFSIVVKEDDMEGSSSKEVMGHRIEEDNKEGRFSRSHSTGHSIVGVREDTDRYTLRLQDDVKAKIIRGHNWTKSCTTFGENSSNADAATIGGFGEVSGGDINKV